MKAWHFVGSTLRDGRPIPADGKLLTHPTAPVLCESGLHASLRPSQALEWSARSARSSQEWTQRRCCSTTLGCKLYRSCICGSRRRSCWNT